VIRSGHWRALGQDTDCGSFSICFLAFHVWKSNKPEYVVLCTHGMVMLFEAVKCSDIALANIQPPRIAIF
jgi:hypothetical protein